MLTANEKTSKTRIKAQAADKRNLFECPLCSADLILKQGKVRIAHFAHKVDRDCFAAKPESQHHYQAKLLIASSLQKRGLVTDVETIVLSNVGDRRADVTAVHPTRNTLFAFEVQDSSMTIEEIERRTNSYASAKVPVLWLPILRHKKLGDFGQFQGSGIWHCCSYRAPEWQRWIFGYNRQVIWFFDPDLRKLWRGWFSIARSYREGSEWYDSSGYQNSSSGGWHTLKTVRELTLEGPFNISTLKFKFVKRLKEISGEYTFPNSMLVRPFVGSWADEFSSGKIPVQRTFVTTDNWPRYELQLWNPQDSCWTSVPLDYGDETTS